MIILPFHNNVAFIFISLLSSYEKERRTLIFSCGYLLCLCVTTTNVEIEALSSDIRKEEETSKYQNL